MEPPPNATNSLGSLLAMMLGALVVAAVDAEMKKPVPAPRKFGWTAGPGFIWTRLCRRRKAPRDNPAPHATSA